MSPRQQETSTSGECSRLEARSCPKVVVADIDTSQYLQKQTIQLVETPGCHPPPKGFAPSLSWQKAQAAKFSGVRQSFARHKAKCKMSGEISIRRKKLPHAEDYEAWCRLCFGRLLTKMSQQAVEAVQEGEDNQPKFTGTPPLLSIIVGMDQTSVIRVLEYHINWFEATGFTTEQGRWFYALLASLEKPLRPEACALLRSLARHCATLRATLDSPADPLLIQLNLLITLITRYFDQGDLADNG
ncbi:gem-associated protein 2-like isoform X2 [Liolophura sinensis]|uniref:gem-associated protein 2-like isoform X2 n=1 Tax=Liolophura sinensis TaxID=3198878 RepID=UPI003159899F